MRPNLDSRVASPNSRAIALGVAGVAGAGLALALGAAWIFRTSIAEFAIRSALADRGIDSDVTVTRVDFDRVRMADLRLGPLAQPDFTADAAEIGVGWSWRGPRLAAVEIEAPLLRAALDENGASFGALDAFLAPGPAGPPRPLPAIPMRVRAGVVQVTTPLGTLVASFATDGILTRSFNGAATLAPANLAGRLGGQSAQLAGLSGGATVNTAPDGGFDIALDAQLERAHVGDITVPEGVRLSGRLLVPAATTAEATLSATLAAPRTRLGAQTLSALSATVTGRLDRSSPGGTARYTLAAAAQADGGLLQSGAAEASVDLTAQTPTALSGGWRLGFANGVAAGLDIAAAEAKGALSLTLADKTWTAQTQGTASAQARLTPRGRAGLARAVPALDGLPMAPQARALRQALESAGTGFTLAAPLEGAWTKASGRLVIGSAEVTAASGARLSATNPQGPILTTSPTGAAGAGVVTLAGGGLPDVRLTLASLIVGPKPAAEGVLTIAPWRVNDSALALSDAAFSWAGQDQAFRLSGDLALTGKAGDVQIENARLALDLAGATAPFSVRAATGCTPLRASGLSVIGLRFQDVETKLCPDADGFAAIGPDGALRGGLRIPALDLRGKDTASGLPARLQAQALQARFGGVTTAARIEAALENPRLLWTLSPDRPVTVHAERLAADTRLGDGRWRTVGRFEGAAIEDPTLPVHLAAIQGDWSAAPDGPGGATVIRFENTLADVTDKEARPRFTPLRLSGVRGALVEGDLATEGLIDLRTGGDRLARFAARHALAEGAGQADVTARDLTFSRDLELVEVSELARGVVENVRGPIDADLQARWSQNAFAVDGTVAIRDVSMATIALGPVEGVSGTVRFDDLTLLTTPPGQRLTVRKINPGVAVENGEIRFQLKRDLVVALEDARFPFAAGQLTVEPTEVVVGAPRSRYALRLSDVDVATFLASMNFKDITATGRIEGVFPLEFTPEGGRIVEGRLQAAPGGGVIQLGGAAAAQAGSGADPVTRLAFDALKGFRYDNMTVVLNGDIDGEIVSEIRFQGVNQAPIDAPGPGLLIARGQTGLPFRYAVTVRAPFRALVDQAAGLANPIDVVRRSQAPAAADPKAVP